MKIKQALRLVFACAALFFIPVAACAGNCDVDVSQLIFPYPQNACLAGAARLPDTIRAVNEAEGMTPRLLEGYKTLFAGHGVEAVGEETASVTAKIVFRTGGPEHNTIFRQEGYEISIENETSLKITVSARTGAGFYYALHTLKSLFVSEGEEERIHTGTVSDYPAFSYRGVLEGGYDVWDHESRVDILEWMGPLKMNYFIYAPKEGYYFRRRWREPFPPAALDEFREYARICEENHIVFAFSLSPALSMEYSNPAEFDTLVAKYRQIQELGVRHFGVFFDDVLPFLTTPRDREAFSHIAEAEVYVTNKLYEKLKETDPGVYVFFVPNQYWGVTPTTYMKIVKEKLHPDIAIGWTGMEIVSDTITAEDARRFLELTGKPPAIGDNWSPPGPLAGRDPGIADVTPGFVNNPFAFASADEAQGSKIVNATVADFTWNPKGYDPVRSTLMAIKLKNKNAALGEETINRLRKIIENYEKAPVHDRFSGALSEITGEYLK